MAVVVARSVNQAVTEGAAVRDVSEDMVLLQPDQAPLLVLTTKAQRKSPADNHAIEWFEDDEVTPWGQVSNGTTDLASNVTAVPVADVTIFAVGDLVSVPKANSSAAAEEVVRVTAVTGASSGTLTITRNIGSAGADTIGATGSLRILGSAFAEDATPATVRTTTKANKTSYIQIFKNAMKVTDSADDTKQYAAPGGEREYQQFKLMQAHRRDIESALLWSRPSQTLASPASVWTTMGLKSRLATNVTDGGTTWTLSKLNDFSETAFRYGQPEKLAVCAPKFISAFNYFSQSKLLTKTGENVFGVQIKQIEVGHGKYMLANNYRMEAGISGANGYNDEMYVVDLPSIRLRYLKNHDTKLYQDIVKDGSTQKVDEIRSYIGAEVRHERKHARVFDVSAYA